MMEEQHILDLIARACGDPAIAQQPDMDLLQSGLLDSLAIITLLGDLDDELGIELQPTALSQEDWRSPSTILKAIARTQGFSAIESEF